MIEVPFAGNCVLPRRLPLLTRLDTGTLQLVCPTGVITILVEDVRIIYLHRGWICVTIGEVALLESAWDRVVQYFGREVPQLRGFERAIPQQLLGWTLQQFTLADKGVDLQAADLMIRAGVTFYGDDKE